MSSQPFPPPDFYHSAAIVPSSLTDLKQEYTSLVGKVEELERKLAYQLEQMSSLSALVPLGRVSFENSQLILVTPVIKMNSDATLCIKVFSEAQTSLPLFTPIDKNIFRIHVTRFQVSYTGDRVLSSAEIPFHLYSRAEAERLGLDLSREPLREAHFVLQFRVSEPGTHKVSVYKYNTKTTKSDDLSPRRTPPLSLGAQHSPLSSPDDSMMSAPLPRIPLREGAVTPEAGTPGSTGVSPLISHFSPRYTSSLQTNRPLPYSALTSVTSPASSLGVNPLLSAAPSHSLTPESIYSGAVSAGMSLSSLPSSSDPDSEMVKKVRSPNLAQLFSTPNSRFHLHLQDSPMYIRNGFAFDPRRTASGLTIDEEGTTVTFTKPGTFFQQSRGDELLSGAQYMWRIRILKWTLSSPLVVGMVAHDQWMPGQSLTETEGALVLDLDDLSVFVNAEQRRIFRRAEKYRLQEGSTIDFYLDCSSNSVLISLDSMPAKEVRDVGIFSTPVVPAVQLYTMGDSVKLEFPFPRTIIDYSDDIDYDAEDEKRLQ